MYFTIKVYVCCGQGSKPSTSCNRLQGGYLKKVTKKLSIGGGKAGVGEGEWRLAESFHIFLSCMQCLDCVKFRRYYSNSNT